SFPAALRKRPSCLAQSPSRRFRLAFQKTRNPVHRATEQNVGEKRQDEGHNQRLQRIEPAKNNHLIDQVHNDGESEDSGDRFERVPQPASSIRGVGEERVEVGGTAFPRVYETVTNREDDRHRRLEQEPERHRAAYSTYHLVPKSSE